MNIPKSILDDPTMFLVVSRIPDSIPNEVSLTNKILIKYKTSRDPNHTSILPKKVNFEASEGSSKEVKGKKKKKQIVKPKKLRKWCLRKVCLRI